MFDFRSDDLFPVKTGSWGKISKITKSRHIILQNKALDVNYSKKLVTGSFKVIEGQKFQKKVKKVQISNFKKIYGRHNFEVTRNFILKT